MTVIPPIEARRILMPVSKLGVRRQVVIPKTIWEDLGLVAGDYVEVERVARTVVLKPKKLVDADEVLALEEEGAVPVRKRRGKATQKSAAEA
jgi:AbrB family looped-hinge helix DNA binding protein